MSKYCQLFSKPDMFDHLTTTHANKKQIAVTTMWCVAVLSASFFIGAAYVAAQTYYNIKHGKVADADLKREVMNEYVSFGAAIIFLASCLISSAIIAINKIYNHHHTTPLINEEEAQPLLTEKTRVQIN